MALALCASSAPVSAQSDLPVGRFSLLLGARNNLGATGDAYRLGWVIGLGAGWHPPYLPVGLTWSITRTAMYRSDESVVNESIIVHDMSFGLEGRFRVSEVERYIFASGGLGLLRAGEPLPPDNDRTFIGPYAGIGYQELFSDTYLISVEARYGLLVGGPSAITLLIGLNFGSK